MLLMYGILPVPLSFTGITTKPTGYMILTGPAPLQVLLKEVMDQLRMQNTLQM